MDHKHCDACPMTNCDHRIQKVVFISVPTVRRADRRDKKPVTNAN